MSRVDDYDYELPKHLIAQYPLPQRSDARLMLIDRRSGAIAHHHIRDLPELLRAGDRLVLNDTRVVPARLLGFRSATGGHWEGLFLAADDQGNWRILAKARGKLQPGETIDLVDLEGRQVLALRLLTQETGGSWIVRPLPHENRGGLAPFPMPCEEKVPVPLSAGGFPEPAGQSTNKKPPDAFVLLEQVGRVPLPHYIRDGQMVDADRQRYQTVFAREPGAVAAPTAGLHFTVELLKRLADRGVTHSTVTLHVGLDTFRPMSVENLADHPMHTEWGRLSAAAAAELQATRAAGGRIIAIGTTSVRVLETAARSGALAAWEGPTDLFIRPPYTFRAVNALLTNFHLPRSTLLVLVRSFGGEALMRRAYDTAIAEKYRFYSYGDAMLIV